MLCFQHNYVLKYFHFLFIAHVLDCVSCKVDVVGNTGNQFEFMEDTKTLGKRPVSEALPWIEKYRPDTFEDIVSHTHILQTLSRFIENKNLPNVLFHGSPGTGKTSTILAIARTMNGACGRSTVLELNASDERGIDVVREQIKTFVSTQPPCMFKSQEWSGLKLVILDEADAMTKQAQFALRRIMEKYVRNTRFCLICNDVTKIIPPIQSRCNIFRFHKLSQPQLVLRLKDIAIKEKVEIEIPGLDTIASLSDGDMRKGLNILQSTQFAFGKITETNVYLFTGKVTPEEGKEIVETLLKKSYFEASSLIVKVQENRGCSLVDIVVQIHNNLLKSKIPTEIAIKLFNGISDIQYQLSFRTNERIQLAALVAVFQLALS